MYNLVPTNVNLNRGAYKKLENEWKRALEKVPPDKVQVIVEPVYRGELKRPIAFEVEYKIGNEPWQMTTLDN